MGRKRNLRKKAQEAPKADPAATSGAPVPPGWTELSEIDALKVRLAQQKNHLVQFEAALLEKDQEILRLRALVNQLEAARDVGHLPKEALAGTVMTKDGKFFVAPPAQQRGPYPIPPAARPPAPEPPGKGGQETK